MKVFYLSTILAASFAVNSQTLTQDFSTSPINPSNSSLGWKCYRVGYTEIFSTSNAKHQGTFYEGTSINSFNDSPNQFHFQGGSDYFALISPPINVPTTSKLLEFKGTAINLNNVDFSVYASPNLYTKISDIDANATLLSSYTGTSFLGGINSWRTESYPQFLIPSGKQYFYFVTNSGANLIALDDIKINGGIATSILDFDKINISVNQTENKIQIIDTEFIVDKIEIKDLTGKEVLSTSQKNISIDDLSNGLYLLNIQTKNGLFVKKIIVFK